MLEASTMMKKVQNTIMMKNISLQNYITLYVRCHKGALYLKVIL